MQDCNSQEKQDVNLGVVHTIAEPDLIEFRFFKALNEKIGQYMIIVDSLAQNAVNGYRLELNLQKRHFKQLLFKMIIKVCIKNLKF